MHGQPGQNTRPHAQLQPRFLAFGWVTLQLSEALIRKLCESLICLDYIFGHIIHGCLYNQALADDQSTGAEIKCLYCKMVPFWASSKDACPIPILGSTEIFVSAGIWNFDYWHFF